MTNFKRELLNHFLFYTLTTFLLLHPALVRAANEGEASQIQNPEGSGEIYGQISTCGAEGPSGIMAYIPGKSFVTIIGTSTSFS